MQPPLSLSWASTCCSPSSLLAGADEFIIAATFRFVGCCATMVFPPVAAALRSEASALVAGVEEVRLEVNGHTISNIMLGAVYWMNGQKVPHPAFSIYMLHHPSPPISFPALLIRRRAVRHRSRRVSPPARVDVPTPPHPPFSRSLLERAASQPEKGKGVNFIGWCKHAWTLILR